MKPTVYVETTVISYLSLPPKAELDAVHIAVASVHDVDFLLTWNFRHIANAALRELIQATCATAGCGTPIICTSLELMGEDSDVS